MNTTAFSAARTLAAAAILAASGLTAHAASWTYALAPGSLLSGGSISGSFAGSDADSDGHLSLGELASFAVSYTGVPGVTTSFSYTRTPDSFSFDLADDQLTFSVTDASSNAVSVNTYDGGLYSVLTATGPDGGSGALTISAVPEPTQLALLGGGLLMLIGQAAAKARRSAGKTVSSLA